MLSILSLKSVPLLTNDNWNFIWLGYRNRQPIQHRTHCSNALWQERLFPLSMPVPNGINKKQRRQESQHRTNTTSMPEPGFEPGTSRTAVEHLPAAPRRSACSFVLIWGYFLSNYCWISWKWYFSNMIGKILYRVRRPRRRRRQKKWPSRRRYKKPAYAGPAAAAGSLWPLRRRRSKNDRRKTLVWSSLSLSGLCAR